VTGYHGTNKVTEERVKVFVGRSVHAPSGASALLGNGIMGLSQGYFCQFFRKNGKVG
jgi:hypothetical protein